MSNPASGIQRRLAAIFCADVAGYSRLMSMDERGTLRLLTTYREITDREIEKHGGRIANTAGDSILAEFPSAVDAVQCAVAVQERIAGINEAVAEERRVMFRIGVHVGEAMVRGGDLFGDDVNIAARLQALTPPGSVCLSGTAHDYVHRVLPLAFEDLGLRAVKNLKATVRAYLTLPSSPQPARAFPFDHRHFEIYWARQLHSVCMDAMDEIAGTVGLKGIDIPVLAGVMDEPNLGPHQLAEWVGIGRATVEKSIARLERRELIEGTPVPGKARSRRLNLTPKGLEQRLSLRAAVIVAQDRLMASLSDQERETLKNLIRRVVETNLGRNAS